ISLFRSNSGRFVRQLSVRTARAAAVKEADRSSTAKVVFQNKKCQDCRDFHLAWVPDRSGPGSVLVPLPLGAKELAPER
ncbi:MAG: hypothetical protein II010_05110, partial [Oscillospiraceae bacterium]|nr:hypothetical protein [Oscillospiraceae bacterium]